MTKKPLTIGTLRSRLLKANKWIANSTAPRHQAAMWTYCEKEIDTKSWNLSVLYEKIKTANDLGYDVIFEAQGGDLRVFYRQRRLNCYPGRF